MIPRFLSSLWWRRYTARNARPWDELASFPRLSPAAQRTDLARRLHAQIQYFGQRADALPEWRDLARATDPDEVFRRWHELPILGKTDLQNRFPATEIQRRYGLTGRISATGGSTGEPVQFFHDTQMVLASLGAHMYTDLRMGWKPGMPLVIVWGSERDIKKEVSPVNRLHAALRNEFLVDGYHLSDQTLDRVLTIVDHARPAAIYGFTTMLDFIARRALETGRKPPSGTFVSAWNGGEMLSPEQSDNFQQAFGIPIFNRYGGRELSIMACQFSADAALEVLRPWLYLEVVDQHGLPVAPGETGRLVWTSTICRGTPFLRYDVEDMGMFTAAHQNESGIFALAELHGRKAGLLELPDGRTINNLYWNHFFKDFPEVRQFQVTLLLSGDIRILLRGGGFANGREQHARTILNHFLGPIPVAFEWVEKIPLTSQGKLVQVVREK